MSELQHVKLREVWTKKILVLMVKGQNL